MAVMLSLCMALMYSYAGNQIISYMVVGLGWCSVPVYIASSTPLLT